MYVGMYVYEWKYSITPRYPNKIDRRNFSPTWPKKQKMVLSDAHDEAHKTNEVQNKGDKLFRVIFTPLP